jgi:hypothetical protein
VPFQDKIVRSADGTEGTGTGERQEERIIKASWTLKHRAPAAAATVNRNIVTLTKVAINLDACVVAIADDNEVTGRLPESQDALRRTGFT